MEELTISTRARVELIDITAEVQRTIQKTGVREGLAQVYVPHTTAGITINENADPSVVNDLKNALNRVIPFDDRYTHREGNSAAHIKSTLVGCSQTVIVADGQLLLGTWQGLFFCEFDGPRTRRVFVKVIPG